MFEVVHFRHVWRSNNEVESDLIRNDQQIATAVVNVKQGRFTYLPVDLIQFPRTQGF
jgi:hypothetical protein